MKYINLYIILICKLIYYIKYINIYICYEPICIINNYLKPYKMLSYMWISYVCNRLLPMEESQQLYSCYRFGSVPTASRASYHITLNLHLNPITLNWRLIYSSSFHFTLDFFRLTMFLGYMLKWYFWVI